MNETIFFKKKPNVLYIYMPKKNQIAHGSCTYLQCGGQVSG